MLALKTIFSKHQGVTSIIFDEVDTGVSGRVAQAIAEKIHQVPFIPKCYVFPILPQVAAMADTHLLISKETIAGRTRTKLTILNKEEKIKEIGRMISGVEITDLTKETCKRIVRNCLYIKNNLKSYPTIGELFSFYLLINAEQRRLNYRCGQESEESEHIDV